MTLRGEGISMTPDEIKKTADEIRRDKKDEGVQDITDADVGRGVVYSTETPADDNDDKPKKRPGGIAPEAKNQLDIDLAEAAETIKEINKKASGAESQSIETQTSSETGQKSEEQTETEPETKTFESTSENTSTSGEAITLESNASEKKPEVAPDEAWKAEVIKRAGNVDRLFETIQVPDDATRVIQLFEKLSEYEQRGEDIKAEAELNGKEDPGLSYTDARYKADILSCVLNDGECDGKALMKKYQEEDGDAFNLLLFWEDVGVIRDYIETEGDNVSSGTGLVSSERLKEALDELEAKRGKRDEWPESLQKAFEELRQNAERQSNKEGQDKERDSVKRELDSEAEKARFDDEASWEDDGGRVPEVEPAYLPKTPEEKRTWNKWQDDVSERFEDYIENLSEDERIAAGSLLAYAHGGELTEHAKEHIDLLRGREDFAVLRELMSEASENGGNQEFQDALEEYLQDKDTLELIEKVTRAYLEAEEEDDTERMRTAEEALGRLLAMNPDKKDIFAEVGERVRNEMAQDPETTPEAKKRLLALSKEMLGKIDIREASRYLSGLDDEIGRALLGIGLGLDERARKADLYGKAGRSAGGIVGILALVAGGAAWLLYKGANAALLSAYKRASKYTPPGLKNVFDKMIAFSQPKKRSTTGGAKSGAKK